MNLPSLVFFEIRHRWKSSLIAMLLVSLITGGLAFFAVNRTGFQKEVIRNARDLGSNVVILPSSVNQVDYFSNGGFADQTMPESVVEQLIEYRASLNHLIPMVERQAVISSGEKSSAARVVGISASIPMPGRPKSPMQRAIKKRQVQLGSSLAAELGIQRDQDASVEIGGTKFEVSRVNRSSGSWQDAAVLMDLEDAQTLFELNGQISRVEAIECTSEACERTGLTSDTILAAELARITDQAVLLRREQMADARFKIRSLSRDNTILIQNALWLSLSLAIMGLAALNVLQRKSEIGVLQALGFGPFSLVALLVSRIVLLTTAGGLLGVGIGSWVSHAQGVALFQQTGKKFAIDWGVAGLIVLVAIALAALASSIPAMFAAVRHPADLIGKES